MWELPGSPGHDGRPGEYNDNEYASVRFDWWPDFNSRPEGKPYEIYLEDGTVIKTLQDEEGNDAIDKPFFAMLKQVLQAATWARSEVRGEATMQDPNSGHTTAACHGAYQRANLRPACNCGTDRMAGEGFDPPMAPMLVPSPSVGSPAPTGGLPDAGLYACR